MTPRERVMLSVNHEEPDRIPIALGGSWYGITDKLYFNLLHHLGWEPVPPFRPDRVHSVNYYDDRLLEMIGADIRHVDPGSTAATSLLDEQGADLWGLKYDHSGLYRTASYHPLQEASVEDIETYQIPDPVGVIREDAIHSRLAAIQSMDKEYAVAGRAIASYGFFEMAQALRKHDQLLMDFILAPEIVHALVSRLFDAYSAMTERFLDVAGKHLDILELPGDDFAGNKHPIISPAFFDQFFKQPYERLVALIKNHSPQVKVVFHSDGAIRPFLPRLAEIGIDIVHPLEPLPATDMAEVKAQFGNRLTFLGGIDIRQALQGEPIEVENEVQRRVHLLGPGGGYILAPSNHLQWDIPPQNFFALFESARKEGRYPLDTSVLPEASEQ